ncbi:hypothetical protein NQP46_03360 [Streptomyces albus]|nr:hypothetical protein NQP46_03360 [Streptomyces albus]
MQFPQLDPATLAAFSAAFRGVDLAERRRLRRGAPYLERHDRPAPRADRPLHAAPRTWSPR